MIRKVKYDLEFKLRCVKVVLEENDSISHVAKVNGIAPKQLCRWVDAFNYYGIVGLESRRNTNYSVEFKLQVLKVIKINQLTLKEARFQFDIPSDSIIIKWQKDFSKFGADGLVPKRKGRPCTNMGKIKKSTNKNTIPLTREEELLKENERLRCENAFLKKFNALIQEQQEKEKIQQSKPLKN